MKKRGNHPVMSDTHHHHVNPADLAAFKAMLGDANVLIDPYDLEPYGHDETEDLVFPPEVVLRPTCTEQVSRIMAYCHEHLIPVTPRGAGTGLSGGALAVEGGAVLSLERMNRIIEIDADNLFAVVESGVINQVLRNEVEALGLFYPPDPASRESCTIGGNLAECSGGPRAVKYGVTKDYVYGLEAVLPDGRIINTGGKLLKNVAGLSLTQLLIGSEGTLAIITRAILRLLPLPVARRTLLIPFADLESAARSVGALFHNKIIPAACELVSRAAIKASEKHLERPFYAGEAEAVLMVEIDGYRETLLDEQMELIGTVCMEYGALDILVADTSDQQKKLWELRRAMGEAVKCISVYKEQDTVVPRAALPRLVTGIDDICSCHGLTAISYGHAGDGNLHVNILKLDTDDQTWHRVLSQAEEEIFHLVVSLGGTITGEHGVGYVKRDFLHIAAGQTEIELMRSIKQVFDPRGILNPGKLYPDRVPMAIPVDRS